MDPVTPRSRRAVLAGALSGVAAAVASSLVRPSMVGATDHSPLIVGEANTATLQTTLTNSTAGATTLSAVATGTGSAILATGLAGRGITGSTQTGIAVRAVSASTGYAVYATSASSISVLGVAGSALPTTAFGSVGVVGFRADGTGVWAASNTGTALKATSGGQGADFSSTSATLPSLVSKSTGGTVGVVGLGGSFAPAAYPDGVGVLGDNPGASGVGVWGRSADGTAILGESNTGYALEAYGAVGVYASGGAVGVIGDVDHATGVQGWTGVAVAPASGINVGVWAGAENGRTALQTQGVVRMNRSGKTTVAVGTSTKKIIVPGGITATSLGFANIQVNRSGFYVRSVVMGTADSSITIYLNANVTTSAITVAWVVIG
jgi:hypothetical protein